MLTKKGEICEDFLKFVHCKSGLTGKDLFKEVVDTLNELELDLKNCRGQGYYGAGAVSGVVNGLSALILKENERLFISIVLIIDLILQLAHHVK